ncbi:TonB-dependent receptor domain-containing protein [Steroidobacter cummioxidans]|uniref:TonB-dependent receptor domain-containing protein n=1 Tax=Steroidobacter cummioxidans TaxID=1803913 RepID=UPI001379D92A|nr:TonB-dependent receptor [Steroidobacter cummioxidans]
MTTNFRASVFAIGALVGTSITASAAELQTTYTFSIPSQSMSAALLTFAEQAKIQVMTASADLTGLTSPGVSGEHTVSEALQALLQGSGLRFRVISADAVAVEPLAPRADANDGTRTIRGVPEILVTGSRVLNMDIRRDRDDPQPYSIFDQAQIEHSGAASVEDFLKMRLTMNSQATTMSQQTAAAFSNNSSINLRGLGASQTLILIDGRRQPSFPNFGNAAQADLNGIPLAAIERIEVLPTTASGIYGGSATGGVVNVVMRRDYEGAEVNVRYEDSVRGDAPNQRVDLAAGINLFGGKTNVMLAGSYMEGEQPKYGDRNFWQRGRRNVLANSGNDYRALELIGDPPLGATPNIRSITGENLVLDNGTPLGSAITHVPAGYTGLASGDGGAALVAQAGTYNIQPSNTAQTVGGSRAQLGQDPQLKSMSLTVRQEIAPSVQGFLQANASQSVQRFDLDAIIGQGNTVYTLPAAAPGNPFQQDIRVTVPSASELRRLQSETEGRSVAGGLIIKLPRNWVTGLDYTWARSEFEYASQFASNLGGPRAAVTAGTVDVLRDTARDPINFLPYLDSGAGSQGNFNVTLKAASARFAGPLWALPGGDMQLTVLAEYREELLGNGASSNFSTAGIFNRYFYPSRSQSVRSAYAELRMPWISARNSLPGVQSLELQLAVRHDDYTTRGSNSQLLIPPSGEITGIVRSTNEVASTDPTFALLYQPVRDVTLRASYGTGFLPPSVGQVVPGSPVLGAGAGADPLRGDTPVGTALITNGGNPNLRAEDSESWSAGLILTPRAIPGLRVSLDYTKIKKNDIISTPTIETLVNFFPERITRGPNLPSDPAGWAGPIVEIDATLINVAKAQVEAFDLQADYEIDTAFGRFTPFVFASRQTHFLQQFLPNGVVLDNVGVTSANPLKLKGNVGLNWRHGAWSVGWAARYFDSYLSSMSATINRWQGNGGRVSSQTYHDVFATYHFSADSPAAVFADSEVTLGIKNLFDKAPPFDANNTYNGYYSTFGDPRLASYWLGIKKRF